LHGFYYLFGKITARFRDRFRILIGLKGPLLAVVQIFVTFNLVAFAWIFFRADTLQDASIIISHMFINLSLPIRMMASQFSTAIAWGFALVFICLELLSYWDAQAAYRYSRSIPAIIKYPAYLAVLLSISLLGLSSNQFIYFHF
jgi:D-alanyl-lipoteichoic acid acyltransferase DltB (MBOAT superfamily)